MAVYKIFKYLISKPNKLILNFNMWTLTKSILSILTSHHININTKFGKSNKDPKRKRLDLSK